MYQNGFKSGQQTNSPNPARAWSELPETLKMATERLKGVQIENLPAVELINRYDTEDVFIYAEPVDKVYSQGIVAGCVNMVTIGILCRSAVFTRNSEKLSL